MPNVRLGNPLVTIVVGGLIYGLVWSGLVWWVVGGNPIIPVIAGNDVFHLGLGASFYGHIIFGHALSFLLVMSDMALAKSG